MSKPKHTPGRWHVEKQRPNQTFTAIGEPIAVVGGEATGEKVEFVIGRTCDFGPHGDEQTEANAYLIAAAPDLLAACKRYIAYRQGSAEILDDITDYMKNAIAKAESGQ